MKFSSIEEMNDHLIDCKLCPRIVKFREEVAKRPGRFNGENFWSRPVPGFGFTDAKLLILGLAPAATGGNRTGRIFTGDRTASFLISSLYAVGLSNNQDSISRNDGLVIEDTYLTAALKCVPPGDKPKREELHNCSRYLYFELDNLKNLIAVLVLGKIAFDSYIGYLKYKGYNTRDIKFGNGLFYDIGKIRLFCSYHPSPRNVNTGLLRKEEFIKNLNEIKEYINR